MKIKILRNEGFKPELFQGANFPLTVKGDIIKKGMFKGWHTTTGLELFKAGCVNLDKAYFDCSFEFSPASSVVLTY